MQDPENYLKAFALLKNPVFAELMESTESVHQSFAEVMKDNGEEKMMFGILDMIKDFGGLVGFQESTQINQNNSSVNIRAWGPAEVPPISSLKVKNFQNNPCFYHWRPVSHSPWKRLFLLFAETHKAGDSIKDKFLSICNLKE